MGPVTVAVLAVAPEGVVDISGPSTEIGVTGRDAGVDDVGTHVPRGGRVRITAGQRQPALVHPVEPVQSAACVNGLRGEGLEVSASRRDLVLLDAADLWRSLQRFQLSVVECGREAGKGRRVDETGGRLQRPGESQRLYAVGKGDDVRARNRAAGRGYHLVEGVGGGVCRCAASCECADSGEDACQCGQQAGANHGGTPIGVRWSNRGKRDGRTMSVRGISAARPRT